MSTVCNSPPDDPLPAAREWLDEAQAGTRRNPMAMALATADAGGRPAVRMVLLRGLSVEQGFAVFYTHYESRKGRELTANQRAAGVLYWEEFGRQLRIEGPVVKSPSDESDAYFGKRPLRSQLNAWASAQSQPLADGEALLDKASRLAQELQRGAPGNAAGYPRPPHWGGYRLWIEALEFWLEGEDRFHDRIRYERALTATDAATFSAGAWSHQRLQP